MKNISELDISNINDAYLLISDEDLREEDLKKLLTNFKKDHIFLLGFECHSHPCHEPILKNGIHNMIGNTFCNYDFRKYTFNNNRYWIPTFHFMPESILSR
jgi:glutathione peroxidase-family protein